MWQEDYDWQGYLFGTKDVRDTKFMEFTIGRLSWPPQVASKKSHGHLKVEQKGKRVSQRRGCTEGDWAESKLGVSWPDLVGFEHGYDGKNFKSPWLIAMKMWPQWTNSRKLTLPETWMTKEKDYSLEPR